MMSSPPPARPAGFGVPRKLHIGRAACAGLTCAAILLAIAAALPGCRTAPEAREPEAVRPEVSSRLAKAGVLYRYGDYAGAMTELIELARQDPDMPGLAELRAKVQDRQVEEQKRNVARQKAISGRQANNEVQAKHLLPDTYKARREVAGESSPLRDAATAMQQVLKRKVTVHLDGADLQTFILALGESENVNIIADNNLENSGSMTIHADEVPLSEILEFAARNLNVTFQFGNDIIWATARASDAPAAPLITRMYRLRKGDPGLDVTDPEGDASNDQFSETQALLLDAINRFVPQTAGSDFLFNKNAHVLIVKNTKENVALVEDIIESLDVTPPQVHIESRFITVRVDDLRELGIDWLLNSPLTVTKKKVLVDNTVAEKAKTLVNTGAAARFTPLVNEAEGLNFTYQGILTDPMFQAVLHALEVSGKARALSVPRVTTVNNNEARIHVGENFLYFDTFRTIDKSERIVNNNNNNNNASDVVVTSQVLVPDGTPKKEQLGISLKVVPSVGADMKTVTLALNPHIENFVRYEVFEVASAGATSSSTSTTTNNNSTSVIKLPIFEESDLHTKVVVQSGETVVMGGIITTTESKTQRKVPILGNIPLLGALFRHEGVEEVSQNLLIFVTATILSSRGEDLVPATEILQPAADR